MKKMNLILQFIRILINKPSIFAKSLYHSVIKFNMEVLVKKKYKIERGLPQIDILDIFPHLIETVTPYTNLYGTSLPIDLAIIKQFAKRFQDCVYLEVGTWRGESLANVAPICKHCVSISLSDEDMNKHGWGKSFQQLQRLFSKHLNNIEHIEANSKTFNFENLVEKFDLIFIDGDHSYEGVRSDTENAFKLLKGKSSIIVWHDYTTNYEHINYEVLAGILDGCPTNKRDKVFHISNTLCAVYTEEDIISKNAIYPAFPDKNFKVTIEVERNYINRHN